MRNLILILSFLAFASQNLQAQSAHIDLAPGKECLEEILHWKDKGMVVMGRGKLQTVFYFVNTSGMVQWKHSIDNEAYRYRSAQSTFSCNTNHMYFVAYDNDRAGGHVYLYVANDEGKFIAKEKHYDHFKIIAAEVTEEGALILMKDNARKDMDRENRIVSFSDETGEQSVSIDIELPAGRWSPQGVFQNAIALKGGGRLNDAGRRDTFCFINAEGKLLERIVLEVKVPPGQVIEHYPRYFFDEDGKCIYAYFTAKEEKETFNTRYCINKYDPSGKILFTVNSKFSDLAVFNEALLKKKLYNGSVDHFFFSYRSWGGLCFSFEEPVDSKVIVQVVMNYEGQVKQVLVNDHFYINEKYFNLIPNPSTPRSFTTSINSLTTIFTTLVNKSVLENPGPLDRVAKMNVNERKPRAYYNVERIGEKDFILEYFPGEGMLKVYN